MQYVAMTAGERVPALGQGTWHLGERADRRANEVGALRQGLDLGLTLIDTAEMYADGGAEEVVGAAIAGRRDEVYLVSKVYPHNATRRGVPAACDRSLRRLNTDRLDLYLLHWRGSTPLAETVDAFEALVRAGKIRHWGVSNFDLDDLRELAALNRGRPATNQILYNLARRGPEWAVLPWQRERSIPTMAYSPIEQGRILRNATLTGVATRHGATPAQVALAWLLRQPDQIVIPKAANLAHLRDNAAALDLHLTDADLAELDDTFPPPNGPSGLEMR